MRFIKFFSIFLLIIATFAYLKNRPESYITLYGDTMGTYYNIKINSPMKNKELSHQVKATLEDVNHKMSVFDNTSEISKINLLEADKWADLSEEMSLVIQTADKVYEESRGYFDPTMGKLVDIWGFGTTQQKRVPDNEEIKQVLSYSGFDKIKFSRDSKFAKDYKKLKKQDARTYINLSALAKGYGVDRLALLLRELGYTDFIVEIGGEIRASGKRSNDVDGWNIGIAEPKSKENAFVVTLKDHAVATSGDYRNFYEADGKRFSHTISPFTGRPVEHSLSSVTVFDKSCMRADALSTAIMAMGEEKGLEFANQNGLAVVLFVRDEHNNFTPILSKKASNFIKQ